MFNSRKRTYIGFDSSIKQRAMGLMAGAIAMISPLSALAGPDDYIDLGPDGYKIVPEVSPADYTRELLKNRGKLALGIFGDKVKELETHLVPAVAELKEEFAPTLLGKLNQARTAAKEGLAERLQSAAQGLTREDLTEKLKIAARDGAGKVEETLKPVADKVATSQQAQFALEKLGVKIGHEGRLNPKDVLFMSGSEEAPVLHGVIYGDEGVHGMRLGIGNAAKKAVIKAATCVKVPCEGGGAQSLTAMEVTAVERNGTIVAKVINTGQVLKFAPGQLGTTIKALSILAVGGLAVGQSNEAWSSELDPHSDNQRPVSALGVKHLVGDVLEQGNDSSATSQHGVDAVNAKQ